MPSPARTEQHRVRHSLAITAAFPLTLLTVAASLGGILLPTTYARETANWAAQGFGQDWVGLLVAVPWLVIAAFSALRGSHRGVLLLAGGYSYAAYQLAIYAFAIHFNSLFLIYTTALGLSVFAFAGLAVVLAKPDSRFGYGERVPVRLAGGFMIAVGLVFAALWLAEIVPALVQGTVPRSVQTAGLFVNPVHVIDLSVVIPAHVACGVLLLRRRPIGYAFAPVVLSFDVLMAASIAGMMIVMRLQGAADAPLGVIGGMIALAGASTAVLMAYLRGTGRVSPHQSFS